VVGGRFNKLVPAQCVHSAIPGGLVELVHFQPCAPPRPFSAKEHVAAWAVNVECSAASTFPPRSLVGDPAGTGHCGYVYALQREKPCAPLAGYRCRARPLNRLAVAAFYTMCVEQRDGFRAVALVDAF
jgi:hypothetical protein